MVKMAIQNNNLPKGVSELTTPEGMAKVLRETYPDNPLIDVPRRRDQAVKEKRPEDIRFWDQVMALLNKQAGFCSKGIQGK